MPCRRVAHAMWPQAAARRTRVCSPSRLRLGGLEQLVDLVLDALVNALELLEVRFAGHEPLHHRVALHRLALQLEQDVEEDVHGVHEQQHVLRVEVAEAFFRDEPGRGADLSEQRRGASADLCERGREVRKEG